MPTCAAPEFRARAGLVKELNQAFSKLPPHEGNYLVRGTSLSRQRVEAYQPNKEITEKAVISTSTDPNVAANLSTGVFFHITPKQGATKGRDIAPFSDFQGEKEIAFPPGTKFKVIDRVEDDSNQNIGPRTDISLKEL